MYGRLFAALLLAVTAASGCAWPSEVEELQAQLDECKADKQAAQEASADCRQRYQDEVEQWTDLKNVVEDVVPRSLQEFQVERERIIELVPEQVRDEVDANLERFSEQFGRAFASIEESNRKLAEDNEKILSELEVAKGGIQEVRGDTGLIREDLQGCFAAQERAAASITDTLQAIEEFNRTYVSDKDSRDRLRLNRNQRETIGNFHSGLMTRLAASQLPGAGGSETEGGESGGDAAGGDTGSEPAEEGR